MRNRFVLVAISIFVGTLSCPAHAEWAVYNGSAGDLTLMFPKFGARTLQEAKQKAKASCEHFMGKCKLYKFGSGGCMVVVKGPVNVSHAFGQSSKETRTKAMNECKAGIGGKYCRVEKTMCDK